MDLVLLDGDNCPGGLARDAHPLPVDGWARRSDHLVIVAAFNVSAAAGLIERSWPRRRDRGAAEYANARCVWKRVCKQLRQAFERFKYKSVDVEIVLVPAVPQAVDVAIARLCFESPYPTHSGPLEQVGLWSQDVGLCDRIETLLACQGEVGDTVPWLWRPHTKTRLGPRSASSTAPPPALVAATWGDLLDTLDDSPAMRSALSVTHVSVVGVRRVNEWLASGGTTWIRARACEQFAQDGGRELPAIVADSVAWGCLAQAPESAISWCSVLSVSVAQGIAHQGHPLSTHPGSPAALDDQASLRIQGWTGGKARVRFQRRPPPSHTPRGAEATIVEAVPTRVQGQACLPEEWWIDCTAGALKAKSEQRIPLPLVGAFAFEVEAQAMPSPAGAGVALLPVVGSQRLTLRLAIRARGLACLETDAGPIVALAPVDFAKGDTVQATPLHSSGSPVASKYGHLPIHVLTRLNA